MVAQLTSITNYKKRL